MLESGTFLNDRYEIIKLIGSGGMANVYMAKDEKLGRFVAVKVMKQEFNSDESFVRKFEIEAQAVARLTHPNIISVYDVGVEQDIHYIVMELCEGITLKQLIRQKQYLTAKETVDISVQIADALECAHEHNIVHRDIKPQNILVSSLGTVKVTDFGIAKAASSNTMTATAIGSVHYLAPEQARGGFSDSRSDIYALGITMYEMVTGKVPFDHENGVTIALMHLQDEVTPPRQMGADIPKSLEKIILKCLAKKPQERYQTANELIADLKQVFDDPEGHFVAMPVFVDDSPTQMIGESDLTQIKSEIADRTEAEDENEDEESSEEEEYEDEYDEDDEEDGIGSKMERLVVILAIVVAIIIAIGIFSFVAKTAGLFKLGSTTASVTTEATTEDDGKQVEVPDMINLTAESAEEMLTAENLKCKIKYGESDDVENGCVYKQSEKGGILVAEGTEITIYVSNGGTKVPVPDVKGKSENSAKSTLVNSGFKVTVREEYSDSVSEGYVLSQTPKAGSKAEKNSTVTVVVSKGSNQATVPSLYNCTQSEASSKLSNAGLSLGKVSSKYSDSVASGCVISQSISAGKKVSHGTSVSIVTSLGPKPASTTESTPEEPEDEFDGDN